MMDFTASLKYPGPALRKIDELEQQRKTLLEEIARLEKENGFNAQLAHITEPSVRQVLNGVVAEMRSMDREALKDMLGSLAEKGGTRSRRLKLPHTLPNRDRGQE